MSKRRTYRPEEIRAGTTLFIVTRVPGQMVNHYGVAEYLVASKREPQPEPGTAHPYRMHPLIAGYAASQTDLWRTRRAAQVEADRRLGIELARMKRGAQ
ncbi:hypothetical protein [Halopseudomonas aestusnigri]|uniref:hypothetical protein n=1 Tax=Halopseudomonas aestusnigri TaxID=857252 RepID=UPI0030013A38